GKIGRSADIRAGKYSSVSQKPGEAGSHVEKNHSPPRHPLELGEAVSAIRPVMNGEYGEGGREGAGAKWQMGGRSLDHGRAAFPALTNHGERRLPRPDGKTRGS